MQFGQLKRREFVSLLGAAVAWPLAARAQQPAVGAQSLHTFAGHSGSVDSVAFSPDGRTVLSGSYGHEIKLWDVVIGKELRTFTGRYGSVNSVAFSPDGRTALSGGDDGLKLWDVATGKELRTFESRFVTSVAFSPDGRTALSGSDTGYASDNASLQLWEVATGKEQLGHRKVYSKLPLLGESFNGTVAKLRASSRIRGGSKRTVGGAARGPFISSRAVSSINTAIKSLS